MDYLTADEIRVWVEDLDEDAIFCEYCLTPLIQTDEGLWYCPSSLCLYDEQGEINPDDEEE